MTHESDPASECAKSGSTSQAHSPGRESIGNYLRKERIISEEGEQRVVYGSNRSSTGAIHRYFLGPLRLVFLGWLPSSPSSTQYIDHATFLPLEEKYMTDCDQN